MIEEIQADGCDIVIYWQHFKTEWDTDVIAKFTAALTAVKSAKDAAKILSGINSSFDVAEVKLKVIDLIDRLSEVQESLLEAKQKQIDMEAENESLRKRLAERDAFQFDREKGLYYRIEADGKKGDIPYCPKCMNETTQKAVPMKLAEQNRNICPSCKYADKPYYHQLQVAVVERPSYRIGDI